VTAIRRRSAITFPPEMRLHCCSGPRRLAAGRSPDEARRRRLPVRPVGRSGSPGAAVAIGRREHCRLAAADCLGGAGLCGGRDAGRDIVVSLLPR
jgi:hypothetical protein